jgi:hypothetical protein
VDSLGTEEWKTTKAADKHAKLSAVTPQLKISHS